VEIGTEVDPTLIFAGDAFFENGKVLHQDSVKPSNPFSSPVTSQKSRALLESLPACFSLPIDMQAGPH